MENWLDGVEGSTLFLARILEQRDYTRAGLEQMLKDIVENNDDIYGATIALNPELVESPWALPPTITTARAFSALPIWLPRTTTTSSRPGSRRHQCRQADLGRALL